MVDPFGCARSRAWLAGIALSLLLPVAAVAGEESLRPFLPAPIWIYNNWSAYDELSDTVPLTEELAMRELDEVLRLRKFGVRIEYYMMDAFWYAPDGGYRTWRVETWPLGPQRWIDACRANGIIPGLWFGSNTLTRLSPVPRWESSLTSDGTAMALDAGEFLDDFIEVLQYWYDEGVRLFKFDFADFNAASAEHDAETPQHAIRERNAQALRGALHSFRAKNEGVVLIAFNGFGGDMMSTVGPFPFRNPVDLRWLDVFDALFPGDPRASDVPQMDFWRSVDIYSDHMVRRFEQSGVPLPRIDSTSAMIGSTGTNYGRATSAWRGMMLLMVARGGWINTIHGNLEFLDEEDARWLAKVQATYASLGRDGSTISFGGVPGDAEPNGFASADADGALYAIVNPRQSIETIRLPAAAPRADRTQRVLFRDDGFVPIVERDAVRLGPGQLALVGAGKYADPDYDLGIQRDIVIPRVIEPVAAGFADAEGSNAVETSVIPPAAGNLRIVMQQRYDGMIERGMSDRKMGEFLVLEAIQGSTPVPIEIRYDKVLWSGLSWAVGEIRSHDLLPGEPLRLRLSSAQPGVSIEGRVYRVEY
jgi:hypothetical protein